MIMNMWDLDVIEDAISLSNNYNKFSSYTLLNDSA